MSRTIIQAVEKVTACVSCIAPRSRDGLEKKVVSHALKHISFLIKSDNQIDFTSIPASEMREVFEKF